MLSSREIDNATTRAISAKSAIAQSNTNYQNAAGLAISRSDIVSSIKTANTRTKNKVNALLTAYNNLNTKLRNLDIAVQRAESKRM